MRLLILSPISPLPVFTGGRRRLFHITQEQARRHEVTFLSFFRNEEEREGLHTLGKILGIRVRMVPFRSLKRMFKGHIHWDIARIARAHWRVRRQQLPPDIAIWDQPAMRRALTEELSSHTYDILQIEWPYLASYALQDHLPPTVLITHDIFSVGLTRRAELQTNARKRKQLMRLAQNWIVYEQIIYPRFTRVAAMSTKDAAIIQQRAPAAKIIISPNGVDAQNICPGPMRSQVRRLLFVGSPTHEPNLDAACWLVKAIWPKLYTRHPYLSLTLLNLDHPRVRACSANMPRIQIIGRVPDVLPFYHQADIALAPIRTGSGTRLKILEAFAAGVPVVSTSIGYEGLHVVPEKHLLVGDSPEALIAAIERLIDSLSLREALVQHARTLVEKAYDWRKIVDDLDRDYIEMLSTP